MLESLSKKIKFLFLIIDSLFLLVNLSHHNREYSHDYLIYHNYRISAQNLRSPKLLLVLNHYTLIN